MLLSEYPWNGNIIAWFEARDYYDQGNRFSMQHSYSEAEIRYRKAVTLYPNDWRFHLVLGKALNGSRKYVDAQKEFRIVVAQNPKSFDGWLELADILASDGVDLKGAEDAARKAIVLAPTNSVARAELAYILGRSGKNEEGQKELDAASTFEKDSGRFWFLSGKFHWGAGDIQRAEAEFRQASLLDLTNAEYWEATGVLLITQKKTVDALECLARAVKLNPRSAPYQNNLGDAQRLNGELPAALASYAKAASIEPGNPEYQLNLGLMQFLTQKYDEAEATLQKAIELNPNDDRVWRVYITTLEQQKKFDLAEKVLQRLLSKPAFEKSLSTWIYLGSLRYNAGNQSGSEDALKHALSLCQNEDEKKQVNAILTKLKAISSSRQRDAPAKKKT